MNARCTLPFFHKPDTFLVGSLAVYTILFVFAGKESRMSFSDSSDDLELMEWSDEPTTMPIKAKSKRKRKIPSSLADIYDTNMEEDRDEKKAKKGDKN